ncbi:MAG: undecaprenyldiphospho-muramoylpentapeptide beta-N-acetylglucosaminyltransferase [Oscillospiraceae bacterium]|jgi:UDP-N-acetylglucosamine--N-acetylmuramyl-(pentapeptide) pyrophosphoryl-undecaprenol N-acetylglucosamine transferase|nr:undecaprenyldiphospho-muramoylpentapeptide beta-N-acetylglucosaminyltransferase [Oscillospiraceae bacterium]
MKIIFAAGGTGGHVNPALAVAGFIREQYKDTQILFVGTKDKIESKLVPAAGFEFQSIEISGFQRKLSVDNIKRNALTIKRLLSSTAHAKRIIEDFCPDVVVGFGGYVSGPVLYEAQKLKIPTAIHEQNAFPGITNKALAKKVDIVMLADGRAQQHLKSKNPCMVTGLPVRRELTEANGEFARVELGLDDRPLILSMGGSLGARAINEAVCELIAEMPDRCNYIHAMGQYGLWVPDKLKELGVDLKGRRNIILREYIDDMHRCMPAADLVICRSGASTLSELQALGKASILIPSPNVSENHQYHNAMSLVNNEAAIVIEEKDLKDRRLIKEVSSLINNKTYMEKLKINAKSMAVLDSINKISDIIVKLHV